MQNRSAQKCFLHPISHISESIVTFNHFSSGANHTKAAPLMLLIY